MASPKVCISRRFVRKKFQTYVIIIAFFDNSLSAFKTCLEPKHRKRRQKDYFVTLTLRFPTTTR